MKTPVNGFHVIETADDPKQLELDASQVATEAEALQKNLRPAGNATAPVSGLLIVEWSKASAIRRPKSAISNQNSPPFFGAIFDWDGVIIDSAKLHEQSWHRLATELGKPIAPESFMRGFGMKSAWIIEKIHRWSTEPAEVARLTERKEALYREIVAQSDIAPLPGAAPGSSVCMQRACRARWRRRPIGSTSRPCSIGSD